ncbi:ATP-grasp domain-containing protein [Paraflavisolibacter sp. H34]|uniref:ATP-grasp domain-containing protein n=1 Tax=Huijunlia imazamoxiresistens TaxID=3127457 RepID=UPI00301A839A
MNTLYKLAVLYQGQQPPPQNGIVKPMKPGGYADSGADIAYALRQSGIPVITPSEEPDVYADLDWVFPDTREGIQRAVDSGADCMWLNTVLYSGHPVAQFPGLWVVGQRPSAVDRYDDKWYTNNLLREQGLPIPKAELVTHATFQQAEPKILPPLVAKPIRGRGSEGVTLITTKEAYQRVVADLFERDRFGTAVYIEEYLPGQEITVTIMPPGSYLVAGRECRKEGPWCLPGVARFNHQNGIAPYNGTVAVIHNSRVLTDEQEASPVLQQLYRWCERAAALVELKAPIRIDCRADAQGRYLLFDLNMKPNMTGPSRPHRTDQDSLSALAARKIGWSFHELLTNMLRQAWKI